MAPFLLHPTGMRVRYAVAMAVVVYGFVGALLSITVGTVPPRREPAPRAVAWVDALGRVEGVDGQGRLVYVSFEGKVLPLRLTPATTVFIQGRSEEVEALSVGQRVRTLFQRGSGTPVLEWIEVEDPVEGLPRL